MNKDEHQEYKCKNVWTENKIEENKQQRDWKYKLGTNTKDNIELHNYNLGV